MELLKRYSISFGIAVVILAVFTLWIERRQEENIPHNLSNKSEESLAVTLPQQRSYEKCLDIRDSQELKYNFEADIPLTFNIHFHADGEIHYPVQENSASVLKNTFRPQKRRYYCLMWGNPAKEKAQLEYRFRLQNRTPDKE